jgi:hypothetical protein
MGRRYSYLHTNTLEEAHESLGEANRLREQLLPPDRRSPGGARPRSSHAGHAEAREHEDRRHEDDNTFRQTLVMNRLLKDTP